MKVTARTFNEGGMSTNTVRSAGVMARPAQIAAAARMLVEQLLQPRRVYLKGKAPKSPYVHQLVRDLRSTLDGAPRKKPMEMVLAISFADIDDGIPVAL